MMKRAAQRTLQQQARSLSLSGIDFLLNPTEEHQQFRDMIAKFAKDKVDPQAREADVNGDFNVPLFKELGQLGAMGITVPEEYGGVGLDATAACIIHHELSKYDPGFCLAYLAHSMLFVNNFFYAANDKQREKYLEKTMSGEFIGAMGMSEPGAGTDVLAMTSTATKKGDYYILNGGKTWITNGTHADVYIVYAKVDGKVTAFVIERGWEGFSNGPKIDKAGMRASTMCQLYFDNVKVPEENVLGEIGGGVKCMMRNLEIERLTLAAMSVGIAERCVEVMFNYAQERKAFGQPIAEFGQIQKYISEAFAQTEAAKCLTYAVARTVGPDSRSRIGTDAAKLFATPVGKEVADAAIQVLGGMGYTRDMPVERLWRDAKLLEIGGGTLESHHKNIMKDLIKMA
ncbi:Isovaleryl-CoA dehydrogenase [Diplonema papillatum]|nr:Isovaleryl-CoA dehydrogenase [Diplonema papillatum]